MPIQEFKKNCILNQTHIALVHCQFPSLQRFYNIIQSLSVFKLKNGNLEVLLSGTIVIRGDWLGKAANINDKNNSAAVHVGRTLKVHNPLFSVGKLLRNKLMQRFYWSIQSK